MYKYVHILRSVFLLHRNIKTKVMLKLIVLCIVIFLMMNSTIGDRCACYCSATYRGDVFLTTCSSSLCKSACSRSYHCSSSNSYGSVQ